MSETEAQFLRRNFSYQNSPEHYEDKKEPQYFRNRETLQEARRQAWIKEIGSRKGIYRHA